MFKTSFILAAVATLGLTACGNLDNDAERAVVGAGIGAGGTLLAGGDARDAAAVGALGAAGGALCDDLGVGACR